MGCIQLPDLDDGRSSRRIRFADVSARMTSTVVSNTLTRSLLINPSSDVKPPLNCVMLRNVMRCRSDGRPSAIVYISLYPRSKHEAQANGHDYVDVDAMAVDEKRRRVDPLYRKISNCLYADSLRLGLVNVTYLGQVSSPTSPSTTIRRRSASAWTVSPSIAIECPDSSRTSTRNGIRWLGVCMTLYLAAFRPAWI